MNINIVIPEDHGGKYVLCATPKHGYAYNSLLFWGKDDSGYYSDINKCQLYTKEEALQRASYADCVPIRLSDLGDKLAIHAEHASSVLAESKRQLEKISE